MKRLANRRPFRTHTDRNRVAKTRHGAIHNENPPGGKLLRKFFKAAHGWKPSMERAAKWRLDDRRDEKVR